MDDISMIMVMGLVQWGLSTVLGAISGWCMGRWRTAKAQKEDTEARISAICSAMADILGDRLDDYYDDYKNGLEFTADKLEKVHVMYQNYSACGGDGIRKGHTEKILDMKL